jgi:sodium/hydrogen antiporter
VAPHAILTVTALLFLLYGLLSRRIAHGMITAPMLGVAAGLVAGPLGSGWVELSLGSGAVPALAEVALAIVLFTGAAAPNGEPPVAWTRPARLLLVGLPLALALGVLAARPLFPEMRLGWLAVMACILAPTDASLSAPIVQNPEVPGPVRDLVGVESGLGKAVALPLLLVLLALAAVPADAPRHELGRVALDTLRELGLGAALGAAVGWAGGRALDAAWLHGWTDETFARLVSPGLAVLAFGLADLGAVDGLVAACCAGLALSARDPDLRGWLRDYGRADGMGFELFVYLLVGATMLPMALPYWDLRTLAYALLSLTAVRMTAVALALLGAGVDRGTVAFVGWFGPRGVASVLFLVLVVDRSGFAGHERLFAVVVLTVLLSIVLHGASAGMFPSVRRRRAHEPA